MLTKLFKIAFAKDRRRYERFTWTGTGIVKIEAAVLRGRVIDISRGGFLFRPTLPPPFLGSPNLILTVKGASLPATILRRSQRGLHCRFSATLTVGEMQALKAMLVDSAEAELQEVPPAGAGAPAHHAAPAATPDQPAAGRKPDVVI